MRQNIPIAKRKVFSQFLDCYLTQFKADHYSVLRVIHTAKFPQLEASFLSAIPSLNPDPSLNILSLILFFDESIVARYGTLSFEPSQLFMLSLSQRVEYPSLPFSDVFDPPFVGSPMNPSLRHKASQIKIGDELTQCALSTTRCSSESPFTILIVSKTARLAEVPRAELLCLMAEITSRLEAKPLTEQIRYHIFDDLIYYIIVNRKSGAVIELPLIVSNQILTTFPRCKKEASALIRKVCELGMEASEKGLMSLFWGKRQVLYGYQMILENESGERILPKDIILEEMDYDKKMEHMSEDQNVICYELFVVFAGRIELRKAMRICEAILESAKKNL